MRVWPGRPYPLGATWDGAGVNFALFSENATQGRAVPVRLAPTPTKESHRIALPRTHRPGLARLPARRAAGPALRLPRPRPLRAGQGASLQSATRSCSILTPRPIGRDVRWDDSLFGYKIGDPAGRPVVRRPRQRRLRPAGRGHRYGLHLGRRPAAAHALAQDAHLRAARQGLHQAASRTCRRSCAAPTPAWPPKRRSST